MSNSDDNNKSKKKFRIRKKRKKIYLIKDINKYFLVIIAVYIIATLTMSLTEWFDLKKNAKNELNFVKQFISLKVESEIDDSNENIDIKSLFARLSDEIPGYSGLTFEISQGDQSYSRGHLPKLKLLLQNKIDSYDNYNYYAYHYKFITSNNQIINIKIVRSLREERRIIRQKLLLIFFNFIFMGAFLWYIYKRFKRKIVPQLKEIENLANQIDLEDSTTLDFKPSINSYYSEFRGIASSYENMRQRIQKQNKVQFDFINHASHELRTPIFVIKGFIDILDKYKDPELLEEGITSIKNEVTNMSELTEKLLLLAKSSNLKISYKKVNVELLILDIIKELNIIYDNTQISLIGDEFIVSSDQECLKIILKNFIENAIKYGNNSPIEIKLNYHNSISIMDNGIGMTPIEIENIFNKFYRGESSHSKNIKGYGLGMAITKNMCDILKIKVKIDSEKNIGTTINIKL